MIGILIAEKPYDLMIRKLSFTLCLNEDYEGKFSEVHYIL